MMFPLAIISLAIGFQSSDARQAIADALGLSPAQAGTLKLDDKQNAAILKIFIESKRDEQRIAARRASARGKSAIAKVERQLESLAKRKDESIAKVLNDEQRAQAERIRQEMAMGIPLGKGIYRSFRVDDYKRPRPILGKLSGTRFEDAAQAEILRDPDGVQFMVTNRGDADAKEVKLSIEFFDEKGARTASFLRTVRNLPKGQTEKVVIETRTPHHKVEVKLVSEQAGK